MAIDRLKKKIAKGRHLSSIKRDRQAIKARARNKHAVSTMRTAVKNVRTTGSVDALKAAIPIIAKNAAKGIIHKRTASRIISRITKTVNARSATK